MLSIQLNKYTSSDAHSQFQTNIKTDCLQIRRLIYISILHLQHSFIRRYSYDNPNLFGTIYIYIFIYYTCIIYIPNNLYGTFITHAISRQIETLSDAYHKFNDKWRVYADSGYESQLYERGGGGVANICLIRKLYKNTCHNKESIKQCYTFSILFMDTNTLQTSQSTNLLIVHCLI